MRFLLDHDVPVNIARILVQDGHEVFEVKDVLKSDASDAAVLNWAIQNDLVLITCNRDDFLRLAKSQERLPSIIILIRRKTRIAECAALISLINHASHSGIYGNINFA